MKITKSQLKQIIKEELSKVLTEGATGETETLAQYLQDRYGEDKAGIKEFLAHQIRGIIQQYAGLQSAHASGEFLPVEKAAKELGIEIPHEAYQS
tara:strand:+ start:3657 stop:3941 length:285 start_codon:yes stop_codon:yes gene_type:complete